MVNTLRITSILAGLLAIALLSLSTVYAIQKQGEGDPEVAILLDAPSAFDVFQRAHKQEASTQKDKEPTLVIEARKFVSVPPVEKVNQVKRDRADKGPVARSKRPAVSAKFELLAINYFASDSSLCSILIRDTAQKHTWLNIGDTYGHQTIKEIKKNEVVLEGNNDQLETMTIQERAAHRLLAGMDYPDDPVETVRPQPQKRNLNTRPTAAPRTSRSNRAQRVNAVLNKRKESPLTPDKVEKLKQIEENISALRGGELGDTPEEREKNARQLDEVRKIFEDRISSGHLKPGDQPMLHEPPPPPTEEEDVDFPDDH